jgi:GDPmannose 4,6-dehydratase
VNYREAYGLFACNGILYNHESPRRGELYVTRKITRAAGRIKVGLQKKLYLGHLDSYRDWGFAGDYVDAMWRMLQNDQPEDFVIATGKTHTVREFLEESFSHLNLDWREHVEIDPGYFRPTDVGVLCGNAEKAKRILNWEPRVDFGTLVRMMTSHDLGLAQTERDQCGTINVLDPAT